MEKQNLIMDDEMVMHETIANQDSISEKMHTQHLKQSIIM